MTKGSIISFEGITCSGKSTLVENFREYLTSRGIKTSIKQDLMLYSGEQLGMDIKILLDKYRKDDYYRFGMPQVETLLILTKRAFESHTRLMPEINQGTIILADRDIDTVCALQLVSLIKHNPTLDVDKAIELIRDINSLSCVQPSLTFYLDVSIKISEARTKSRDNKTFTNADIEFNNEAKRYYSKVFNNKLNDRELITIRTSVMLIQN